jgi:hypothetical protein
MKTFKFRRSLFLILLISFVANSQIKPNISNTKTISSNPQPLLFLINGNVYELAADAADAFLATNIQSLNVIKSEDGIARYGEKARNGVVEIITKNIGKKDLQRIIALKGTKFEPIKNKKKFIIKGAIKDCDQNLISGATVVNLNSKNEVQTDAGGNFEIEVTNGALLEFFQIGFKPQRYFIENKKAIALFLKSQIDIDNSRNNIRVLKPIIYLYPELQTAISLKINFKGNIQTTFPKYEKSWEVEAFPDGKIYDIKTSRFYQSLFWDGEINLESAHYIYDRGFVVFRDNLANFLIEKLEQIGLNNNETNDFVQFWLPILEKNEFNFIHFLTNEKYDAISTNEITPTSDTNIRVFMEFFKTNSLHNVKPQFFLKTNRKGFTLVEWGGSDVSSKVAQNLN